MNKKIAILGSTGSIGKNALRVIDGLGDEFEVFAVSGHGNYELLAEQVREYRPKVAAVTDEGNYGKFKELLAGVEVEILCGREALVSIAEHEEVDIFLTAVVGAAGLESVLAAAENGKRLAIANKEPLVIAGELLTEMARANNAEILPVDSEHSAIFQAMMSGKAEEVKKLILTASGGPFREHSLQQIKDAGLKEALDHPTWDMGPKITVDSATMMNKALEVIEAKWLFDVPVDKIDVLIHPESIIHSMVEFVDGSTIAQLSPPDMCLPIQYALTYPERRVGITEHLRLDEMRSLTFEKPDMEKFRALKTGFEAARMGGSAPVVFNAANESAVELFLEGKIKFINIIELVEDCLERHSLRKSLGLDELLEIDAWARNEVIECLNQRK